jgi:hypothetical protein
MLRHPRAIVAIPAPDRDRRAHHVRGHVTSHAGRLRREGALVHVGHQPVGIRAATGVHPLVEGLRLARRAEHGQPLPRPRAPEERGGQGLAMRPARAWGLLPSTGGEPLQRGRGLPMTPMRVEHGASPPLEGLPLDRPGAVLHTLRPALPAGTQDDRSVVRAGGTEHRRDRQDDRPRDAPRVPSFPPLTAPVIRRDLGTPSAPRRLTAHRHQGLPWTAVEATRRDSAPLHGVPTGQPRAHEGIVIRGLIAGMSVWKRLPGIGTDRREATPRPCGCCQPLRPPREEGEGVVMPWLSHRSSALSTPPQG